MALAPCCGCLHHPMQLMEEKGKRGRKLLIALVCPVPTAGGTGQGNWARSPWTPVGRACLPSRWEGVGSEGWVAETGIVGGVVQGLGLGQNHNLLPEVPAMGIGSAAPWAVDVGWMGHSAWAAGLGLAAADILEVAAGMSHYCGGCQETKSSHCATPTTLLCCLAL